MGDEHEFASRFLLHQLTQQLFLLRVQILLFPDGPVELSGDALLRFVKADERDRVSLRNAHVKELQLLRAKLRRRSGFTLIEMLIVVAIIAILAAVSSFMGLLNSYREICKEREIIFREASVGVSLGATVLAKMVTLALISLVQASILTAGFVRVIHVPQNDLLLDTDFELYITVLLILLSSASMGLLVSAAFKNSESAILFVLVLIIAQVVFSGALFPVSGAMTAIGYLVTCRWGMGAFGASTDLNSRLAWLKAGFDGPMYDATVANLLNCWQMLGLIAGVCILAAWLVLQINFDRKKS